MLSVFVFPALSASLPLSYVQYIYDIYIYKYISQSQSQPNKLMRPGQNKGGPKYKLS